MLDIYNQYKKGKYYKKETNVILKKIVYLIIK